MNWNSVYLIFIAISAIATSIAAICAFVTTVMNKRLTKENQELMKRQNELQEENNRISAGERVLDWRDVEKYADVLTRKIQASGFEPTCIFVPDVRSVALASMIAHRLKNREADPLIPFHVGLFVNTENEQHKNINLEEMYGYELLPISDYDNLKLAICGNVRLNPSDRVLIVRAYSLNGGNFHALKKHLKENRKVLDDNIKTACIFQHDVRGWKYTPDYFCFSTTGDVWFPWGKTI